MADATGVVAYLMMPPIIYGTGSGFFNRKSMQVPFTITHALDQGWPEYIGDGTSGVGYVHIDGLASLYELVLGKVLGKATQSSGRKCIYFFNAGDYTWKALNENIGEIVVQLGALKSATPASISLDEANGKWGFDGDLLALETNHAAKFDHPFIVYLQLVY